MRNNPEWSFVFSSVAAKLSEGFGSFFYKEIKQFFYYSRSSLSENRKLISEDEYEELFRDIKKIGQKLNSYINSLGRKSSVALMTID